MGGVRRVPSPRLTAAPRRRLSAFLVASIALVALTAASCDEQGGDIAVGSARLATVAEPVDTVLRGPVDDQDGLHTILARIQDLGLELVEIRQLPST